MNKSRFNMMINANSQSNNASQYIHIVAKFSYLFRKTKLVEHAQY